MRVETSDLVSALRVAKSSCLSAQKEAVWSQTTLRNSQKEQYEEIETVLDTIAQAAGALQDALYRAEQL